VRSNSRGKIFGYIWISGFGVDFNGCVRAALVAHCGKYGDEHSGGNEAVENIFKCYKQSGHNVTPSSFFMIIQYFLLMFKCALRNGLQMYMMYSITLNNNI
jgi:hypothetical protein